MSSVCSMLARMVVTAVPLVATSAVAGTVRGNVMLGPTCPGPISVGQECAGKPIATTIDVFRTPSYPTMHGKPYRRIKSDKQGRFEIFLDPDTYWFVPHVPPLQAGVSFAKPVMVVVSTGTTT